MVESVINHSPFLELDKHTWIRAGRLSMEMRSKGLITPLTDLFIAALALEGDHEVYTLDDHFQRVPGLCLHEAI